MKNLKCITGSTKSSLVIFMLLLSIPAISQNDYSNFYSESLKINNTGMVVLGSWAILNISTGAYGWSRYTGQSKYFHQMNLFWNVVNLSIAGIALYGNAHTDYSTWEQGMFLEKHLKTQNLFLINAGLDIGYMGGGLLLRHFSGRRPNNSDRLKGYGNSVILQGAFLFVFDLVMYGLQRSHRGQFLDQLSLLPMNDGWGLALRVTF